MIRPRTANTVLVDQGYRGPGLETTIITKIPFLNKNTITTLQQIHKV